MCRVASSFFLWVYPIVPSGRAIRELNRPFDLNLHCPGKKVVINMAPAAWPCCVTQYFYIQTKVSLIQKKHPSKNEFRWMELSIEFCESKQNPYICLLYTSPSPRDR